jgi:hypothetical protein
MGGREKAKPITAPVSDAGQAIKTTAQEAINETKEVVNKKV